MANKKPVRGAVAPGGYAPGEALCVGKAAPVDTLVYRHGVQSVPEDTTEPEFVPVVSWKAGEGPPCTSPETAATLLAPTMAGLKQETFRALFLDSRNRVIENRLLSVGTLDITFMHPRDVFRRALLASAAGVILAHNHPSGDPTPSKEDLEITRRLREAGKLLQIPVLDAIVIGEGGRFARVP